MTLIETVAVTLGPSIAKSILKNGSKTRPSLLL
jgi:hypothetical protein